MFLGERQVQIGNIGEIIGPIDLPAVTASFLTISLGLHQPCNPSHYPSPIIEQTGQYYSLALTFILSAQNGGCRPLPFWVNPTERAMTQKAMQFVEKKALDKKAVRVALLH